MILFVLLWVIAVIILISDFKSPTQRWLSAALFLAGLAGLHQVFNILLQKFPLIHYLDTFLIFAPSYFLYPYAFLMYAIFYLTSLTGKHTIWRKRLVFILLFPVIAMYCIWLFAGPVYYSDVKLLLLLVPCWVTFYFLTAYYLIIRSYFQAQTRLQKKDIFMTCITIIPLTLSILVIGYIMPSFHFFWLKSLLPLIILILFIRFLIIATRNGVMGIKLRIEKLRLDNAIQTMTSGAAILNHSIKNEINKISMGAIILNTAGLNTQTTIQTAEIMLHSTEHILNMIDRTQHYSQDIIIVKSKICLRNMIETCLRDFEPQFREKNIKVLTEFSFDNRIQGDPIHLREVINNIIKNALEAMEPSGKIEIKVTKSKGLASVIITDNGLGIPEEVIPHLFEPFFTTKDSKQNFGLGLSYCYRVLKKHGGALEIESEPNKGTTVYLNLPAGFLQ